MLERSCKALFGHVDFNDVHESVLGETLFLAHGSKGALVVKEEKQT